MFLDVTTGSSPSISSFFKISSTEASGLGVILSYLTRVTETGSAAHDIVRLARELEDCKADIVRLQAKLETLKPWLGLDISMRTRGTRETAAFVGTFPQEMTREEILLQLAEKLPEVQAVEPSFLPQPSPL